jgi:leader peptidase (prepilin peptidase) / N-methyltransferase
MSNLIFYIFIFVFGLIIGSFLNCIIYRLNSPEFSFKKSLAGRSFCPYCRHSLNWQDLIPLFSFLFLKGKCRYCGGSISWRYPIVEITTGFLFVFFFQKYFSIDTYISSWINIAYYWFITSSLLIIFFYDLKHQLIPDKIVYPAIGLSFLFLFFNIWNFGNWNFYEIISTGTGIIPSFFFLAINLFSQGKWMGLGDFKLALLMGLVLGWPAILFALILAFYSGAIIGIAAIISGSKKMKSEIPFAPFLVAGTFATIFWQDEFTSWFERLFLLE